MNAIQRLLLSGLGVASITLAGCASSTDETNDTPPSPAAESESVSPKSVSCTTQYSDVVPAYIDYASVHCQGWTGKVFCEYSSLSSVYGPGWGTCQCYNTVCTEVADPPPSDDGWVHEKRGRACRAWWCR